MLGFWKRGFSEFLGLWFPKVESDNIRDDEISVKDFGTLGDPRTVYPGTGQNFTAASLQKDTGGDIGTGYGWMTFDILADDITLHTSGLFKFNAADSLSMINGTITIAGQTGTVRVDDVASAVISDITNWHHIVIEWDSVIAIDDLQIGYDGTNYLDGVLFDVQFGTTITPDERTASYNQTQTPRILVPVQPNALHRYYLEEKGFDSGSSATKYDLTIVNEDGNSWPESPLTPYQPANLRGYGPHRLFDATGGYRVTDDTGGRFDLHATDNEIEFHYRPNIISGYIAQREPWSVRLGTGATTPATGSPTAYADKTQNANEGIITAWNTADTAAFTCGGWFRMQNNTFGMEFGRYKVNNTGWRVTANAGAGGTFNYRMAAASRTTTLQWVENVWIHIVVTATSGPNTFKFYADGVFIESWAPGGGIIAPQRALAFGTAEPPGAGTRGEAMAKLFYYASTALTEPEILDICDNDIYPSTPTLGYYCNEDVGETSVADWTGNQYDASAVGSIFNGSSGMYIRVHYREADGTPVFVDFNFTTLGLSTTDYYKFKINIKPTAGQIVLTNVATSTVLETKSGLDIDSAYVSSDNLYLAQSAITSTSASPISHHGGYLDFIRFSQNSTDVININLADENSCGPFDSINGLDITDEGGSTIEVIPKQPNGTDIFGQVPFTGKAPLDLKLIDSPCIDFDGSNRAVDVTPLPAFASTNDYTIVFYHNHSTGGTFNFIFDAYSATPGGRLALDWQQSATMGIYTNGWLKTPTQPYNDGLDHHVVVTINSLVVKIYVDGSLFFEGTNGQTVDFSLITKLVLGGIWDNTNPVCWDGFAWGYKIFEGVVWTHAQVVEECGGGVTDETGLILDVPLSDKYNRRAYDRFNKVDYPINSRSDAMWTAGTQDKKHVHVNEGCDVVSGHNGSNAVVQFGGNSPAEYAVNNWKVRVRTKQNVLSTYKIVASCYQANASVGVAGWNVAFSGADTFRVDCTVGSSVTETLYTAAAYTDYDWHYFEVEKDGTTLKITDLDTMVEDSLVMSSATMDWTTSQDYKCGIGARWNDSSNAWEYFFTGLICDVEYIDTDTGLDLLNARCVDGDTTTQITDDSTNANHGVIIGTHYFVELPINYDGTAPTGRTTVSNPAGLWNTHTTKMIEQEVNAPEWRGINIGDFATAAGGYAMNGDPGTIAIGVDTITGEGDFKLE